MTQQEQQEQEEWNCMSWQEQAKWMDRNLLERLAELREQHPGKVLLCEGAAGRWNAWEQDAAPAFPYSRRPRRGPPKPRNPGPYSG